MVWWFGDAGLGGSGFGGTGLGGSGFGRTRLGGSGLGCSWFGGSGFGGSGYGVPGPSAISSSANAAPTEGPPNTVPAECTPNTASLTKHPRFSHLPIRPGKQLEHTFPSFWHEQFLRRPPQLQRQQSLVLGIPV